VKVPRQCPLVLLENVGLVESKASGIGEGRTMRSEARREVEQGLAAFDENS
jgi:hypothetical protein